ncbi:MAG: hypothetical protein KDB02_11220 [Acidimicrobiales bacterium]|nr:hypothetical protein [Acidimicrobiales bacterium]
MTPGTRIARTLAAFGLAVGLAVCAAGCGTDVGRTALVPHHPRWVSPSTVRVTVECSDHVRVTVEPGSGVDLLPLVTIWGDPNRNRCQTQVDLEVPPGTTRIDDAASGRVIDLPPRPKDETA